MAAPGASAWATTPGEEESARARGGAGAGAAASEELPEWLAQALAEERRAVRSALERSHQESREALDRELGRTHGALVAQVEGWGARRAGALRLPAVVMTGLRALGRQAEPEVERVDAQALGQGAVSASSSVTAPASARQSARAPSVRTSVLALHRASQGEVVDRDSRGDARPAGSKGSACSMGGPLPSPVGSPRLLVRPSPQKAAGPESEPCSPPAIPTEPERPKSPEGTAGPVCHKSAAAAKSRPSRRSYSNDRGVVSVMSANDVQERVTTVLWKGGESRRSPRRGQWAEFVDSTRFEVIMGVIIMLNSIQMAFEVQFSGLVRGNQLEYRRYSYHPDPWPGANQILNVISVCFGVIFALEVSIKLCALRSTFFHLYWNVFDLMVVLFWLVEMSSVLKGNLENTTALRLARLARLLRLVRLVRQIRSFDALFLMTTAIKSSLIVLAWSCVLLLMIQVLVAFVINQLLEEFYFPFDHDEAEKKATFEYFGTFSRALLSTFEMTLANWPPVCRLLMENVSEWFMVLCLFHKLTVGFAVLGVINGVFTQETFRVAAQDDFIMVHQKEASTRIHLNKMSRLFKAGDVSGDGLLDRGEFLQLMQNQEVRIWLSSMGLEAGDEVALFEYLDKDEDGNVSAEELIKGVGCLKGAARSLDLIMCLNKLDELHESIKAVHPEIVKGDPLRGPFFTSRWGPAGPFASRRSL